MPDPFERHSRHVERDWGSQPSRAQARAAAAEEPDVTPRGQKDRWARCKANHGGPHDLQLRLLRGGKLPCGWVPGWDKKARAWSASEPAWSCGHGIVCRHCGKIAASYLDCRESCPAYPGTPAQREAATRIAVARNDHAAAWRAKRAQGKVKPPPPGTSRFRRKRKEKGG